MSQVPAHESSPASGASPPSRLARRLGTFDAVVIGLGAMIGAGVFSAIGPAAGAAGKGLLLGLVVAAVVAWCNATSSAQLAALQPEAGGTYSYGRKRLGPLWGFLAGWAFLAGKTASCTAMALTFGHYAAPHLARPVAFAAVAAVTAVNCLGVRATARVTLGILAVVLLALTVAVAAALLGGQPDPGRLWPPVGGGIRGVLQAAGFLFFAFAGYARLATLGEEVLDPARTIPRAIPLALGIALVVYAVVAASALLVLEPAALAASSAPLASAVEAGSWAWASPAVRVGAAVACAGVLLSLLAGMSRTFFAMSANGDLPRAFSVVDPKRHVPQRAQLVLGALVGAAVLLLDVPSSIGFSSFAVLFYYAVANASAFTLAQGERRWPRWVAVLGVAGCLALAVSLPPAATLSGAGLLALGALLYLLVRRRPH